MKIILSTVEKQLFASSLEEEETRGGGAILTPPGAGGDVHGGPGVHPDTPVPPSPDAP